VALVATGERLETETDHGAESPLAAAESERAAGASDTLAAAGPFTSRQLFRIDEALGAADRETGLTFSVYVGSIGDPLRAAAEKLHDSLPDPDRSVLVVVSPNQRVLEIVTGPVASKRVPDRACELAGMSMRASFLGGDLAGGIVVGLRMLADRARGR
jgi:hypothetical protein